MGKAVVVQGCKLEDITGGGTVTVTSAPSSDVLADGKGVFFKEIQFSVSGSNGGGSVGDNNGSGSGAIQGTGASILDGSGNKVVLLDDQVTITVNGTSDDGDESASGSIVVKVTDAGQSDVIAL